MTKESADFLPDLIEASRALQRRLAAPDPELVAAHRRARAAVSLALGGAALAPEIAAEVDAHFARRRAAMAVESTKTPRLFAATPAMRFAAHDLTRALRNALTNKESNKM